MGDSVSGGMQMGRDRNHSNTNYTYLGQDSQTNPLMDYGQLIAQLLGQNQAQTNSLYGGKGYGNSYGKVGYGGGAGGGASAGGGSGVGSQMRAGGYGGAMGGRPGLGGGNTTQPYSAAGYGPGGHQNSPEDGVFGDGGDGVYNFGTDPGAMQNPALYGPGTGAGPGDPGGIRGVNGNYQYPTDDAYYPRNPEWMNDADNARPSPIRPQGSNIDPWNAPLDEAMGAPEGGLYGLLNDWAAGGRTPYEEQIGQGYVDQYNNPNDPYVAAQMQNMYENPESAYDTQAADQLGFLAGGGMTGLEGETRGNFANAAAGNLNPENWETRAGFVGQTTGPNSYEDQSRQAILDFINGGGGASGTGYGLGGGSGSMSGSSSPVGLGAGYSGSLKAFQDMVNGGGYSDAEKAALVNEGMGSARAGLDSAQAEMMRRGELTGNRAGMYGAMAQMAGNRSNVLGSQARKNVLDIANEAQRRKEVGAGGMGNLAGIEGSLANAQLSANTSMNNASLANQAANRGMNLQAIGALGDWDAAQRKNAQFGLGGMNDWDKSRMANQQFGMTGMQQGDLARRQSMMGGATGLADYGQNIFGRKAGALGALGQYGQQGRENQMGALAGMDKWANQGRANQQFGVQGLSGLYNTQNSNQQELLNKLFQLFSTPTEKRSDATDTSGSGGFNI